MCYNCYQPAYGQYSNDQPTDVAIRNLNICNGSGCIVSGKFEGVNSLDTLADMSSEDRAKVIGGLVAVGVAISGFVVFIQLFGAEYSLRLSEDLKYGSSIFASMSVVIVVLYFFTVFPMMVAGGLTTGLLAKHSIGYCVKDIVIPTLLVTGAIFSLIVMQFSIFGVVFSSLSETAQAILLIFAVALSSIAIAAVLKTKRVKSYIYKN
jgi:membrane-associated HD superfamily phosphohydrolase